MRTRLVQRQRLREGMLSRPMYSHWQSGDQRQWLVVLLIRLFGPMLRQTGRASKNVSTAIVARIDVSCYIHSRLLR